MRKIKLVYPCPTCGTVLFCEQYIPKEIICLGCKRLITSNEVLQAVEKSQEQAND